MGDSDPKRRSHLTLTRECGYLDNSILILGSSDHVNHNCGVYKQQQDEKGGPNGSQHISRPRRRLHVHCQSSSLAAHWRGSNLALQKYVSCRRQRAGTTFHALQPLSFFPSNDLLLPSSCKTTSSFLSVPSGLPAAFSWAFAFSREVDLHHYHPVVGIDFNNQRILRINPTSCIPNSFMRFLPMMATFYRISAGKVRNSIRVDGDSSENIAPVHVVRVIHGRW